MRDAARRVSPEEMTRQEAISASLQGRPDLPRTYHVVTYGCQMNAHDSETLAGLCASMGMEAQAEREKADLILFNTCCIRDNAERRAIGNIIFTKELRKNNPRLLVGVCGCMAQQEGFQEKLRLKYPHVDFAMGPGDIHRLPEKVHMALESRREEAFGAGEDSTICEGLPILRQNPFSAWLTVMYGCDNFCSYCVVPMVRGRERSRGMAQILKEAEELVRGGVQEITLLGQNVNSYGLDGGHATFPQLLRELARTGIGRLRFMTSNPKDLSDELIAEMARNPAVCPHLHLPAQSGSDRMLATMNRRYTSAQYLDRVRALREAIPCIGLSTDLIVAFPGETEDDFYATMSLVEEVRFDSAFTFIFSPRAGTRAAALPGRVMPDVASDRIARLIAAQETITAQVFDSLREQRARVLVESVSRRGGDEVTGKTERNISCTFRGGPGLIGTVADVVITGRGSNTLKGSLIPDE